MTAHQENYETETGLLNAEGLRRAVEVELSRAARHELPVSIVLLEVLGVPESPEHRATVSRVGARVSECLLGRVRAEDRVARLGELRFAVLAPEAGESGSLAKRLGDYVVSRLAGAERLGSVSGLSVAVASVECQYDEMSGPELIAAAERELAVAILERQDIPFPPPNATRSLG